MPLPEAGDATDGDLAAELSVDYSEFADAFGGDFADRLQVVALPDCALQDPVPAGCLTAGTPLPSVNNTNAQELVVEVEDLKALAADDGGAGGGEIGGVPVDEVAEVDLSQLGVTTDGDNGDGVDGTGEHWKVTASDGTQYYEWLANRVDVNDAEGRTALEHGRIDQIINPQGGTLDVTYGQNRPCASTTSRRCGTATSVIASPRPCTTTTDGGPGSSTSTW